MQKAHGPVAHFNSISHCVEGSVDFERVIKVDRNTDVQFNKPFCLLKPNYTNIDVEEKLFIDKGRKGGRIWPPLSKRDSVEIEDLMNLYPNATNLVSYGAMNYVTDFAQGLLDKMVTHKKIEEYLARKSFLTSSDLECLTSAQLQELEFHHDLVCYNLARRKKYAKRNMAIYAPMRFIGGIFECSISSSERDMIVDSYKESLETPPIWCDTVKSKPIAPLISEDISKQWFQMTTSADVMQRIPFLHTPTNFDLRFESKKWFEEIDVNEEYHYTEEELHKITELITETTNKISETLLKMESQFRVTKDKLPVFKYFQKFAPSKFLTMLSLQELSDALTNLEDLETCWDNLNV